VGCVDMDMDMDEGGLRRTLRVLRIALPSLEIMDPEHAG